MRIAVTGKGGVGKTTVAAVLSRTLARTGRPVLALDADPNPNLGIAIGLGAAETERLEAVVNRLLREKAQRAAAAPHDHADGGHGDGEPTDGDHAGHDHAEGAACEPPADRTAEELVAEMGVAAPDGVTLVQTGRVERPADGCLCCGSHGTTRRLFSELGVDGRVVVADLEAGVNDLIWARPTADDTVLVVTAPYAKSIAVAQRAIAVSRDLGVNRLLVVANRVTSDDDLELVRGAVHGVEVVAVPDDDAVRAADRGGAALLDLAPDSPVVAAVSDLARRLVDPAPVATG